MFAASDLMQHQGNALQRLVTRAILQTYLVAVPGVTLTPEYADTLPCTTTTKSSSQSGTHAVIVTWREHDASTEA
jgi:hypothetical protein